jgi:hypothetical protein
VSTHLQLINNNNNNNNNNYYYYYYYKMWAETRWLFGCHTRGADMTKNIDGYFNVFAANIAEMLKIKDLFE